MKKEGIELARKTLEAKWDSEGECASCGWHAALWEHSVDDWEIEEALNNGGILELSCISDDEDSWSHRGIKIEILTPSPTI